MREGPEIKKMATITRMRSARVLAVLRGTFDSRELNIGRRASDRGF